MDPPTPPLITGLVNVVDTLRKKTVSEKFYLMEVGSVRRWLVTSRPNMS